MFLSVKRLSLLNRLLMYLFTSSLLKSCLFKKKQQQQKYFIASHKYFQKNLPVNKIPKFVVAIYFLSGSTRESNRQIEKKHQQPKLSKNPALNFHSIRPGHSVQLHYLFTLEKFISRLLTKLMFILHSTRKK
jgi:hypothetical protein